jgi:hypothetical protein
MKFDMPEEPFAVQTPPEKAHNLYVVYMRKVRDSKQLFWGMRAELASAHE